MLLRLHERRLGGLLLVAQRTGVEQGLAGGAPDRPKAVTGREQGAERGGIAAERAVERQAGKARGDRHADLGGGDMQAGLGRADIGPLADELRRHAERQIGRQAQVGEIELKPLQLGRRPADEDGELVVELIHLLLQRRNALFGLLDRAFGAGHIDGGGFAARVHSARDVPGLSIGGNRSVRSGDLRSQPGDLKRGAGDVAGQRQISRLHLEALIVLLRRGRLEQPFMAAEDVQHVGRLELRCIERVILRVRGQRRGDGVGILLPNGGGRTLDGRKSRGALRETQLARLEQGLLRRREVRIMLDRFVFERVERRRSEQGPPATVDRHAPHEMLSGAIGARRGRRRCGRSGGQISIHLGRSRTVEIRAYGAAGDEEEREERTASVKTHASHPPSTIAHPPCRRVAGRIRGFESDL